MIAALEKFLIVLTRAQLHNLLSYISTADMLTLGRVSITVRNAIRLYQRTIFDFRNFFSDWFSDVERFRRVIYDCNAVISGSQALQFFERLKFSSSDMDIFARAGGLQPLTKFLIEMGYKPRFSKTVDEYEAGRLLSPNILAKKCILRGSSAKHPLLGVYNFSKTVLQGPDLKFARLLIQIVIVDTEPVNHIVFGFHSSK